MNEFNATEQGALLPALVCLLSLFLAFAAGVWPMLPRHAAEAEILEAIDLDAAVADVEAIAATPHPLGSPENRRVRDVLVGELEGLGLEVEIQRADLVYDHPEREERQVRAARVENVLARLRGSGQGPSLVVMSHYDSRPAGPGAADAASGVAAVLAAARAIAAGPQPRRDVWFVITDGEERGLLGAQAFFRQHPAGDGVGLVLNFEARGSAGPSMLFETGAGNGAALAEVQRAFDGGRLPVGTSLGYEIYRFMSNDTDMTISKGEAIPGLNFAFIDAFYDYHTEGDRPENLSRRSLAEHVHNAVSLTRHFAALDALPAPGDNATFFLNPSPWPSFVYGEVIGGCLFALALLLTVAWFARDRFETLRPFASVLRAALALVLVVIVIGNTVESIHDALLGGVSSAHPRFWQLFYQYPQAMVGYGLLALGIGAGLLGAVSRGLNRAWLAGLPLALAVLLFLGDRLNLVTIGFLVVLAVILLWYRKPLPARHLAAAGALIWLLLAGVAQFTVTSAAFIVVLPLIWVAGLSLLLGEGRLRDALIVVVPCLLWASIVYAIYLALGVSAPSLPASIAGIVMLLLAPALVRIGAFAAGAIPGVLIIAGGHALAQVATTDPFSERFSRPTELFLSVNANTGEAHWRSSDPVLNDWLGDILGDTPEQQPLSEILPTAKGTAWTAPARVKLPPPRVTMLEDRRDGGRRHLRMSVDTALSGEHVGLLFAPGMVIQEAAINHMSVTVPDDLGEDEWWTWSFYGDSREGIEVQLVLDADSPFRGRLVEVAYRWPDGADPPPRAPALMRRPYAWADATVIYRDFGDDAAANSTPVVDGRERPISRRATFRRSGIGTASAYSDSW